MNALETKVLELIGESTTSPDVFVDTDAGMAPIRDSLNDAVQEIAMLTGGVRQRYVVPLRQDVAFYRLRPAQGYLGWIVDAWAVNNKRRLEQTDLVRLVRHNPGWVDVSGSPEAYFPVGQDVIGVYPVPGSDSDVIELAVVEIPAAYTGDTDPIRVREQFQHALVNYAVAEYWAGRGDAQEAGVHFQKYLAALNLRSDWNAIRDPRGFRTQKEPWPVVTS